MSILTATKLKFLTERHEKFNRSIHLHEKFIVVPSKLNVVSSKFYAKHDTFTVDVAPQEYLNFLKNHAEGTPKKKYDFPPPSVNMDYGWFDPLVPKTFDKRWHFPAKQSAYIKQELKIKEVQKKIKEKKFEGKPFKL